MGAGGSFAERSSVRINLSIPDNSEPSDSESFSLDDLDEGL
jgi:hypothetical protein